MVPNEVENVVPDEYAVDTTEPLRNANEIGGEVTMGGEVEKSDAREDDVSSELVFVGPKPSKEGPTAEFSVKPEATVCKVAATEPDR